MVGAAASFHDVQADGPAGEPALELGTRQALTFDDAPVRVSDGELEDGFGEIDAHDGQRGGSIHLGLSVER
jgi:hypothetical protein